MKIKQGSAGKQAWESVIYEIDCSDRLPSAVTISAVEGKVFDSSAVDQSATMIEGTPSISGSDVFVQVKAGTDGEDYNLRVRLTLSNGEYAEDDITISIRDRA